MAPPRPTDIPAAAGRVAVSEEADCIVVRCDVRAATLRYGEEGVLELRLPKALFTREG